LARLAGDAELVTLIAGDGAPLAPEAAAALVPDGIEVDAQDGGHPSYWWLIAAE
jgi:fatty acid kinase